ncbi:DUF4062 domain-containing protein [Rhizobium sp. BG4]|uniref:DUF4062 domain-containing protein n=1 Tax=Rhizobium sp. BG4 TaxID=2613770 RepID=UPI00193CEBE7|nr:DUF4062 domain-containing protein [Rhizobium sp. BG4]QRM44621.1 DUF4062 domain-containing protein [Rhizobium sp. BG4]
MTDKRYQIFISSTFTDLQAERRAVQDTVISMGDFPVQMESFPATDQKQMDFITPLIEECDYYILIIGGRYGTVDNSGLSFTHQEFRCAVERNIPVLVMIHGKPEDIAAGKSETTDLGRKKLQEFIEEAQQDRIRKAWETLGDLKLAVREALDHAKRAKPRTGWVRGDTIAAFDALEELNEVRKENEKFKEVLGNLAVDIPLPRIPAADAMTTLTLTPLSMTTRSGEKREGSSAKVRGSWISFFPLLFSSLEVRNNDWQGEYYWHIDHEKSCVAFGSAIAAELAWVDTTSLFSVSRGTLNRLIAYYTEAGLMTSANEGESPFTEVAQRIARRHHIVGEASSFEVVDGEVSVRVISPFDADEDSRIPF